MPNGITEGLPYKAVVKRKKRRGSEGRVTADVESALPDLDLQVRPAFPFRHARNVVTGQAYAIKDGAFAVHLPKTTWVAIELLP